MPGQAVSIASVAHVNKLNCLNCICCACKQAWSTAAFGTQSGEAALHVTAAVWATYSRLAHPTLQVAGLLWSQVSHAPAAHRPITCAAL